jgi:hypothetical protein
VAVNALVGGTLGQERTVVPLLAVRTFHLEALTSAPRARGAPGGPGARAWQVGAAPRRFLPGCRTAAPRHRTLRGAPHGRPLDGT